MDARRQNEAIPMKNRTMVERKSERELVIKRTFNGPARIVFEAWTKPELLQRWWGPKSAGVSLLSCEADVRVGGRYRFVFGHGASEPMAFYGTYLEVTPHERLVWTNEEGGDGGAVTTVTFEEKAGKTLVVVHELYPSKEALDRARASGVEAGTLETFEQLDELLPWARAWDAREVVAAAIASTRPRSRPLRHRRDRARTQRDGERYDARGGGGRDADHAPQSVGRGARPRRCTAQPRCTTIQASRAARPRIRRPDRAGCAQGSAPWRTSCASSSCSKRSGARATRSTARR